MPNIALTDLISIVDSPLDGINQLISSNGTSLTKISGTEGQQLQVGAGGLSFSNSPVIRSAPSQIYSTIQNSSGTIQAELKATSSGLEEDLQSGFKITESTASFQTQVKSTSLAGISFHTTQNNEFGYINFNSTGDMLFSVDSVQTHVMKKDKSVGIGTIGPSEFFHVSKSAAGDIVGLIESTAETSASLSFKDTNTVTSPKISSNGNGLNFTTNNSVRLSITEAGLISSSSDTQLALGDNTVGTERLRIAPVGAAVNLCMRFVVPGTAPNYIIFNNQNGVIGSIVGNATNTAYNTSSDKRLKKDFRKLTSCLSKISKIDAKTYKWKVDDSRGTGFVAQDLYKVFPEAVHVGGDDEKEEPWSVDYSKLTPILWNAIKEQQDLIESLEKRIETLEMA